MEKYRISRGLAGQHPTLPLTSQKRVSEWVSAAGLTGGSVETGPDDREIEAKAKIESEKAR